MVQRLDQSLFKTIVTNTPLISIDLIIRNEAGMALLGQRLNQPAQGYWFVPGGRIFKDEKFNQAFSRICQEELGYEMQIVNATFLNVFEHFYQNNFSSDDFSTHYVVHAYELSVLDHELNLPYEQHSSYKWFDQDTINHSEQVHQYTKDYFI